MDLRQRAESVVRDIGELIPTPLDDEQKKKLAGIVEGALVDFMRETAKHHSGVVAAGRHAGWVAGGKTTRRRGRSSIV